MALDQLDKLKTSFGPRDAQRVQSLLERLKRKRINDPETLIRLHELLLFVRAHPHNATVARLAEEQLRAFAGRVSKLREREVDLSGLEHPSVSGVAGTSVTDTFSFYIVRWLAEHFPTQLEIFWEWFESENRLAETWPRFMPLLEEDANVEANVPYRKWLAAARGRQSEISWLVERFDELAKQDREKAELYDSQQIYVQWTPRFRSTRTGLRAPHGSVFYHREPFIQRRDVNLRDELNAPPPQFVKLSRQDGEQALNLALEASTIRYRELYGFTHGDPAHVYQTDLGRGVQLHLFGLPPEKRLPLRASHATMIYKNGVPIGYFEGLSLFERMESGFNLYYTFRDGETAWLYARILNVMRHFAGVTAFAIEPYQIGHENEEGIESGAFWFYRKLGFRSTKPEAMRLTEKEEQQIATRKGYRTSARTLRKLAESPMIFELDERRVGDWDRFQVRKIGLRMQGRKFESLASLIREASWTGDESRMVGRIVRAKRAAEETTYLKLMQRHERLRAEVIKLGS
ncbi:MAG TPA: hypothetical protein VJP89_02465 [Pyrinomonadaceae bacterium]|nr:hypothetical protein [Pyrinomonadaceae bacterium]